MKTRTATMNECMMNCLCSDAPLVNDELFTVDYLEGMYAVYDEDDSGVCCVTIEWIDLDQVQHGLFLPVDGPVTGKQVLDSLSTSLSSFALRAFGFSEGL